MILHFHDERYEIACGWLLLFKRRPGESCREFLRERLRILKDWNRLDVAECAEWKVIAWLGICVWIWK